MVFGRIRIYLKSQLCWFIDTGKTKLIEIYGFAPGDEAFWK